MKEYLVLASMRHRLVYVMVSSLPSITCVYPEVYGAKPGFAMEKLGTVCVYPCPNMMVIVCCGIRKVGVEPSMVVRL
jgi:hypothetical protein